MNYGISFKTADFKNHFTSKPKEWLCSIFTTNNVDIEDIVKTDRVYGIFVKYKNIRYMTTISAEEEDEQYDGILISVERERSVLDKMLFSNKMQDNDALLLLIHDNANLIEDVDYVSILQFD